MKLRNLLLLTVVLLGLHNASEAQTVPEVQMPVLTKVTATWCPNCGTWGWTLFEGMLADNTDKAIFLNAHYSGDLTTPASQDFAANLNANGQPKFYFDNMNTLASANTVAAKRMEIAEMVNTANAQTPIANTGLEYSYDSGTYTINTKTKFFDEMTGNIHLSIVALESKLTNNQASQGIVDHTFVVRGTESSNTFGPMIASGTIAAGTEIDGTYTLEKGTNWNEENIILVAMMWSEENSNFTYINGSVGSMIFVNSLSNDLGASFTAEFRSNQVENELFINTDQDLGNSLVNIYNVNGQLVQQLFKGNLIQGEYHLPVSGLTTGNYFIEINTEKGQETIKAQF